MPERWRLRAHGLVFDVLTAGDPAEEPVLLLHGFPQTAVCWTRLAGARSGAVRDYRMAELVADVLAAADRAGVGAFHLVGHDWGGMVAWHLAAQHPERVATLTAVSTSHPRAIAAALRSSAQPLRSAYIASFRTPACPSWSWGARAVRAAAPARPQRARLRMGRGLRQAPWPTGEPWPRRWPGTGGRPVHPSGPGGGRPHLPPVGLG